MSNGLPYHNRNRGGRKAEAAEKAARVAKVYRGMHRKSKDDKKGK